MSSDSPRVLLLGPARDAVSGVSTHLNQLLGSALADRFELSHFRVGSEGRTESRTGAILRVLASPLELAVRLACHRPRIVHINTSLVPKAYWRDLIYLAVAKAFRRKVVYQVHGGALPAEFFAGHRLLTRLLRRALSSADAVVLLSQRELAAYRDFVPDAHVELIANAVEIPDAELGAERYASGRPLEIVYLGRLAGDKGILDVVAALATLRDRGVDARLTIAGRGPAEGRVARAIAAHRLEAHVELLGAVFGPAKQRLWRRAQIFAFPTLREGLPYALLESMAAGVVPVVVPVGAIPDVVTDGVHGLFVPPCDPPALADALERLHLDRSGLRRMALAGRRRITEHYSVARLAADFQRLYSSLAPAARRVRSACVE